MEVANVMDSSSKCSKMSLPVDNEQDFYLSIQPNVINPKLLLLIIHFLVQNYFILMILSFLENTSRSNDARSSKC
jgi:hypothetical protein